MHWGDMPTRAALHGASARVGMFASRFPSSRLSKNASFPTVGKRLVLHHTSARSVLTGRRPGPRSGSLSYATCQGRAAEDVGPYHPSCPDAAWRAKDSRRPRRVASELAWCVKDPRRLGAGRPNESCA